MKRFGPLTRLGDLKVATRISIGFGIAFALVVALALVGLVALYGVTRDVTHFSANSDTSQAAAVLDIGMRDLDTAVRNHLDDGDETSLDEAQQRRDALVVALDALTRAAEPDRRSAARAREALDAYWTGFQRLVELRGERRRLTTQVLEPLVAQMRVQLGRLKDSGGVDSATLASDAAIGVLLMQDHATRFVERRDPRDAERMRAELASARTRLAEMNRYLWVQGTRQTIQEVEGMLGSADAVLDRLEEMLTEEDRLHGDVLVPNGGAVTARAAEIRARNDAAADSLRSGLAEGMSGILKTALWVGGIVLLLGLLAAWFVARSVAKPVGAMASAVTALAEGRTDGLNLPALTRNDEIGSMARAVATLRNNAEEVERLKREAEELQSELLDAKERAEEANAAKTNFLVNMGQELHRPLNDIILHSQSLMSELHRVGAGELANDVEMIQWSGEQLVTLVDSILDYARIEAGAMDVCLQDFDVGRLIAEVRERVMPLADLNGNTLTVNGQTLGGMNQDFNKVRQALLNLLDNACKFTRDGRVSLDAERTEREGQAWLRFSISDTGSGFPAAQAGRLFQPFVQGAGVKGKVPGAGLGLTLVGHTCAMLGGDIEVASEPGKGTRITLWLPAVYRQPVERRPLTIEAGAAAKVRPLLRLAELRALPAAS